MSPERRFLACEGGWVFGRRRGQKEECLGGTKQNINRGRLRLAVMGLTGNSRSRLRMLDQIREKQHPTPPNKQTKTQTAEVGRLQHLPS